MTNTIRRRATSAVVDAVDASPQRSALPLEAILSLPVPVIADGRVQLAFFWTSRSGPAMSRLVTPPYCRTVADPGRATPATFERIAPETLDMVAGAPVSARVGEGLSPFDRKRVGVEFHTLTDDVSIFFASRHEASTPEALATLTAYRTAFDRLAVVALRPAYRALGRTFFEWLEATVPSVVDP